MPNFSNITKSQTAQTCGVKRAEGFKQIRSLDLLGRSRREPIQFMTNMK